MFQHGIYRTHKSLVQRPVFNQYPLVFKTNQEKQENPPAPQGNTNEEKLE
jgi:hypothetical protein